MKYRDRRIWGNLPEKFKYRNGGLFMNNKKIEKVSKEEMNNILDTVVLSESDNVDYDESDIVETIEYEVVEDSHE